MQPVITIIGAGNMGQSLIGGLIQQGFSNQQLIATDRSSDKRKHIEEKYRIRTDDDNLNAIEKADVVIFAVKPQVFSTIAKPLAKAIQAKKPLLISIAAGVPSTAINEWLGGNLPIIRAMPNTPALIGQGATGFYANDKVDAKNLALATSILSAFGIAIAVSSEGEIDTVTAISGSGPAYFFLMIETMIQTGITLGLTKETATQLAIQTAIGAAQMAKMQNIPITTLRKNVTSPGGTTEKALSVLEQQQWPAILASAIEAAKHRSEELAHSAGEQ